MKKVIKHSYLLLLLLMLTIMTGCQVEDIGSYNIGGRIFTKQETNLIYKIDIEWEAGDILIKVGDYDDITIYCLAIGTQHSSINRIRNNTLEIKYCSHKVHFGGAKKKDIEIHVPKELIALKEIEIESNSGKVEIEEVTIDNISVEMISGEVYLKNVTAKNIDIETVSSDCVIENVSSEKIEIDSTSGDNSLSGSFEDILIESVSGDNVIKSTICPSRINIDSITGNTLIQIPENDGFEVKYDIVTGKIYVKDFSVTINDNYVYKNGLNKINLEVATGDVTIEMIK